MATRRSRGRRPLLARLAGEEQRTQAAQDVRQAGASAEGHDARQRFVFARDVL